MPLMKDSPALRLKQLKLQKLQLLQQKELYERTHALEFVSPQDQQKDFFTDLQNTDFTTFLVLGGNRCLAGSEEIFDPVANTKTRVDQIKKPFHTVAWNGWKMVIAKASSPFQKGQGKLVRVTLATGQQFCCAPEHRVLSSHGFSSVERLKPGFSLFLPPTTWDISRLARDEDDQNFWRTVQGFLSDCLVCSRLCGGPLLPGLEDGPSGAPSLLDALERIDPNEIPFFGHRGARDRRLGCNRSCRLSDPLSNRGDLPLPVVQFSDILSHVFCRLCKLASDSPQAVRLSKHAFDLQQSINEFVQPAKCSPCRSSLEASETPLGGNSLVPISNIEEIGVDVKWDFEVPGYGNYVHNGAVHHNSGKSFALAAAVCSHVLGRFPWLPKPAPPPPKPTSIQLTPGGLIVDGTWFADEKAYKAHLAELARDKGATRFKPPIKVRVLGEDYEKAIGQVLLPYFFKFIPPELIVSKRKGQTGVYNQITVQSPTDPNAVSIIDFLTYAQGSEMMEGWDGHLVAYDEPPPRSVYIANQRGLVDHRGISIFALTPLKEPWIADEIANNPDPSIRTFVFKSHDNPHIDQQALAEFERKLSDDEKATRIEGKFLHLTGLVWKEFNKAVHVVEPFEIPKNYTVWVAIDTHARTEQAVMFMAVDQKDRKWVVHDIFRHGTPDEVANWIINFHDAIHPVHKVIIEPGSQGDKNRGDSTYEIINRRLADENIPLELGSKDLQGGILQVREHLKSANGQPSLWFFNTCTASIKEILNYVWDEFKSGHHEQTAKQVPKKLSDHLCECLRRLIQHPAEYCAPGFYSNLLEQVNKGYQPTDTIAGY